MGKGLTVFFILCVGAPNLATAAAGNTCRKLLDTRNFVSLREQVAQVRSYEQKASLKYKKAIRSDLEIVSQILKVYRQVANESARTMSSYMRTRRPLAQAPDAFLAARYTALSKAESGMLTKVLKSTTFNPRKMLGNANDDEDLTAAYIPERKRIHFEMPERYKDTLIYWFTFAHEMEHAIQDARLNTSFANHDVKISAYAMNEIRYLAELGAMTAEWVFLQGVAPQVIAQQQVEIAKANDIEKSYREYYLRALANAHLPLQEYLRREHEAGRYSRQSVVYEEDLE